MNKQVILRPFHHRGQESIAICFANHSLLNGTVRRLPAVKWSQTNKCWYVPLNKESYNKICFALKDKAIIEKSALHEYLSAKNKRNNITFQPIAKPALPENTPARVVNKKTTSHSPQPVKNKITIYKGERIQDINAHVLPLMKQQLKLKAYSPSTIKTYLGEMAQLLNLLKNIPADDLQPEHMKRYMVYCYEKLKLTENTLHSRINAMKFYYEQVLRREKFFWEIPRPKKPWQLPNVLGEKEITRLFNAVNNLKHKAILFTAYSAGLRVSEVVSLRICNISSDRMQIKLEAAKGKKDRYVTLSPVLLDVLRAYIKKADPRPATYLFENETPGEPYSSRSAQKVFQRAREKAGIHKKVSFHSLRHSFATHLLEKGVDIRYIKDILGHFSIKTTERYTHVKKEQLIHITSPLDDLWLKGEVL